MSHSYSIEILYHFNCAKCTKWWSISDWTIKDAVNCPHCGFKSTVVELKEVQND